MKDHQTKTHVAEYPIRHSRWISTALALALLAVWSSGAFAQIATQVKLVPNEATIAVGQVIDVTVQVENVTNLFGVEMLITFDRTLLEVVDADPDKPDTQIAIGNFLSGGMNDTNAVVDGNIEYIMQLVNPSQPANGTGALAHISFKGIGSGMADIIVEDLTLYDQAGNGIGASIQGARITIQAGSVDGPTATPFSPTAVPAATPAPPTPVPPTPVTQATAAPPITAESLGVNCVTVQGYHIVQRGETLYAIARAYATDPYAIGACNPTINPRRIHASNHLAIPYAPWTPPPGPTATRQFGPSLIPAPVPTPAPGCRVQHVVQPYETLTAIGLKYNTNIWDIARVNRIYNLHLINSGQVLCIP